MAGKQGVIPNERGPVLLEVRQRNRLIYFGGADVAAYLELEFIFVGILEETFVEGAVMIEGDFGVALENMGKGGKWISGGSGRSGGGAAVAPNGNEIFERALGGCTIIKRNDIMRRGQGCGRQVGC